jgi:hypothetical protein
MMFITDRPIDPTCPLCGAFAIVTQDIKALIPTQREAVAIGYMMGVGSVHADMGMCPDCKREVTELVAAAHSVLTS